MKTRIALFICIIISTISGNAQESKTIRRIILAEGEKVWAGVINDGHLMPFSTNYAMDFFGNNKSNQAQPLILTNKGQFAWSEQPYQFEIRGNEIIITDPNKQVVAGKSGNSLAEVQRYVRQKYFPSNGKSPDNLLFSQPQYNTWIELTYNQNQADVLKYVQGIIDNGFPPGVLLRSSSSSLSRLSDRSPQSSSSRCLPVSSFTSTELI